MSQVSVTDVAKYILEHQGAITTMKLQKLAFYSHAWHLAWTDEPLVREQFRAWRNGPVCYELFDLHRGNLMIDASSFKFGEPSHLSDDQKASIEAVLKAYGKLSGGQLSELTHEEAPWKDARASAESAENPSDRIDDEVLKTFFRNQINSGVEIDEVSWLKA